MSSRKRKTYQEPGETREGAARRHLDSLRRRGVDVVASGKGLEGGLEVSPSHRVSDEMIDGVVQFKAEILELLRQEEGEAEANA